MKPTIPLTQKQQTLILIGIIIVAIAVVVLAVFLILSQNDDFGTSYENTFNYALSNDSILSFSGTGIKEVRIQFDGSTTNFKPSETDYVFKKNIESNIEMKYNGPYVARVIFRDGEIIYRSFTIQDNPEPITLSSNNGIIQIQKNAHYQLNNIYYSYGNNLGIANAKFYELPTDSTNIESFGNGWHTFRINATSDLGGEIETKTYYVAVKVSDSEHPAVLLLKDAVGLFSYGFDIQKVLYTKKNSQSEEVTLDTKSESEWTTTINNNTLDVTKLTPGEIEGWYTFCFKGTTQNYYITKYIEP